MVEGIERGMKKMKEGGRGEVKEEGRGEVKEVKESNEETKEKVRTFDPLASFLLFTSSSSSSCLFIMNADDLLTILLYCGILFAFFLALYLLYGFCQRLVDSLSAFISHPTYVKFIGIAIISLLIHLTMICPERHDSLMPCFTPSVIWTLAVVFSPFFLIIPPLVVVAPVTIWRKIFRSREVLTGKYGGKYIPSPKGRKYL